MIQRSHQGTDLQEYFHILLKRKWWIIGTFSSYSWRWRFIPSFGRPSIRTTAMLQITQDNPGSQVSVDDKLSKLTGSDSLEKFQQTQYKILQS